MNTTSKDNHNQLNLMNFVKIFTKLMPILSLMALLFGGLVTITYLDNIGQTAIFPDILTSSSALLSLMVVFLGLSSIFLLNLISPYLILEKLNINFLEYNYPFPLPLKPTKKPTSFKHWLIIGNIVIFLLCIITIFLYSIYSIPQANIPLIFILILITYFLIIYNQYTLNKKKNILDNFDNIMIFFSIPLLFFLTSSLFISIAINITETAYPNDNEWKTWGVFAIFVIIWSITYAINGYIAFQLQEQKGKFELKSLTAPIFLFFTMLYFISIFDTNNQLQRFVLRPLHFIEYPTDSDWYTIDTRFFAPNNLTWKELQNYSDNLQSYLGYTEKKLSQCEFITEKEEKKQCENFEQKFKKTDRYNRFYGYFAWNLGDTKVFCPQGYKNKNQTNDFKCLAIKSEYIIPFY